MKIRKKGGIGIIGDSEDNEDIRECPRCHSNNVGQREYAPHEYIGGRVPSDSDKWLQCYFCYKVFARYEAKKQSQVDHFVETSDNRFDEGGYVTGIGNKRPRTAQEKQRQRLLDRIDSETDPDIKQALRRGCTVRIIEDSELGKQEALRYIEGMQPEKKNNLRDTVDDLTDY